MKKIIIRFVSATLIATMLISSGAMALTTKTEENIPQSITETNEEDRKITAVLSATNKDHEHIEIIMNANIYYDRNSRKYDWDGSPTVSTNAKKWGYSLRSVRNSISSLDGNRTKCVTVTADVYDSWKNSRGTYTATAYFYLSPTNGTLSTSSIKGRNVNEEIDNEQDASIESSANTEVEQQKAVYISEENAFDFFKDILDNGEIDLEKNEISYNGVSYGYQGIKDYVNREETSLSQEDERETKWGFGYSIKNDSTYYWFDNTLRSSAPHNMYLTSNQSFKITRGQSVYWEASASGSVGVSAADLVDIGVSAGWKKSYSETFSHEITVKNYSSKSGFYGLYPIYVVHTANLYKGSTNKGIFVFNEPISYGNGYLQY